MIRTSITVMALAALSACGDGNPFGQTTTGPGDTVTGIPDDVAGSVTNFTFNPADGTLTLTGLLRDEEATAVSYNRRPALDVGEYQAFTAQDDPLDTHTTVYTRQLGNVTGAVGVAGVQFFYYSGGVNYQRSGGFDPIAQDQGNDTGLVTYAGDYVGITNVFGPDTDRLPVPGNPDPGAEIPGQASIVTGRAFINVGFADNSVAGVITDREIQTRNLGNANLPELALTPANLESDGTFTADVELRGTRRGVGTYSGIIGGPDSDVLAGGLYVEEHFDTGLQTAGEEEFGLFVLGRCGGPREDPSAECSIVDPE